MAVVLLTATYPIYLRAEPAGIYLVSLIGYSFAVGVFQMQNGD